MSAKRAAAFFAFAENYVVLAVNAIATIVVARLLLPEEIGLFSVAAAVVFLGSVLRDFGVGTYVVQEQDLTELRLRTAFTLTCVASWLVGLALIAARSAIAGFYGVPDLADVLGILGINFALIPFGSVTLAYMRRTLMFGRAAVVNIASAIVSCVTVVTLAYRGYGYFSPAWASIAGTVAGIALLLALRPAGLPWRPSLKEARHVLSFSAFASMGTLVGSVGSRMPDLLIGKVLDMHSVGIFSRATGMLDLFNTALMNAINKFALPHFADVHRSGADMEASFLQTTRYITAFSFPFFASLAILAPIIVRVLFGNQWDEAVPLAQVLCVSAAVGSPYHVWTAALTAIGRYRKVTLLIVVAQAVNLAAMVVAIRGGLLALAVAMACAGIVSLAMIAGALRVIVPVRRVARAVLPNLTLAAFTVPGPVAGLLLWQGGRAGDVVALCVAIAVGTLGWIVALRGFGHPVYGEFLRAASDLRRLAGSPPNPK